MAKKDQRIDVYIDKSAAFAKPVLRHLRGLVHKACPGVEETIKWGMPHFDYRGSSMCGMAAFRQHCVFGFRKAKLMSDPEKIFPKGDKEAMGQMGAIKGREDLPSDKILIAYIKEAARLNKEGIKLPSAAKAKTKAALKIPGYFLKAVSKNKKALATFNGFSYSNKKEYVQWITEAKTDATRNSRLETAVAWMSEGKIRNWKYMKYIK